MMEDLSQIMENLPTINEIVRQLNKLKESGTLDTLVNLSFFLKSLKDMVNDESIKNIGEEISSIALVVDKMKEKKEDISEVIDKSEELNYLMQKIEEMRKSGALDTLVSMSYVSKSLKDMLTDDMIVNLGTTLSLLLDFLPKATEFLNNISPFLEGFSTAMKNSHNVTLGSLISAFRDPEFQKGMGIIVSLVKILGKS